MSNDWPMDITLFTAATLALLTATAHAQVDKCTGMSAINAKNCRALQGVLEEQDARLAARQGVNPDALMPPLPPGMKPTPEYFKSAAVRGGLRANSAARNGQAIDFLDRDC